MGPSPLRPPPRDREDDRREAEEPKGLPSTKGATDGPWHRSHRDDLDDRGDRLQRHRAQGQPTVRPSGGLGGVHRERALRRPSGPPALSHRPTGLGRAPTRSARRLTARSGRARARPTRPSYAAGAALHTVAASRGAVMRSVIVYESMY